jgi:hypothetical protein
MNENIKMNKAYQYLPFLRSTLKCPWWGNRKNGIHSNQQHYSTCWDKFPDAKESVMKYCSSVVIGGIDAGNGTNAITRPNVDRSWLSVSNTSRIPHLYPSSVKNKTRKEERLKLMWRCLRYVSLTLDWFTHHLLTKSWSFLRHQEHTNTLQTA